MSFLVCFPGKNSRQIQVKKKGTNADNDPVRGMKSCANIGCELSSKALLFYAKIYIGIHEIGTTIAPLHTQEIYTGFVT